MGINTKNSEDFFIITSELIGSSHWYLTLVASRNFYLLQPKHLTHLNFSWSSPFVSADPLPLKTAYLGVCTLVQGSSTAHAHNFSSNRPHPPRAQRLKTFETAFLSDQCFHISLLEDTSLPQPQPTTSKTRPAP